MDTVIVISFAVVLVALFVTAFVLAHKNRAYKRELSKANYDLVNKDRDFRIAHREKETNLARYVAADKKHEKLVKLIRKEGLSLKIKDVETSAEEAARLDAEELTRTRQREAAYAREVKERAKRDAAQRKSYNTRRTTSSSTISPDAGSVYIASDSSPSTSFSDSGSSDSGSCGGGE